MESNCNKIYLGSSSIETAISPGSRKAVTVIYLWSRNCTSAGSQSPADIASGRIAEVRRRSMSCNCMTRTSQQECRGILEVRIRKSHQDTPDGSFPILFEGGGDREWYFIYPRHIIYGNCV